MTTKDIIRPKIIVIDYTDEPQATEDPDWWPPIPADIREGDFIIFKYGRWFAANTCVWRVPSFPYQHRPCFANLENREAAQIYLPSTVMLDDAFDYYKDVFSAKCAENISFTIDIKPSDPGALTLGYGTPGKDWDCIRCIFYGRYFNCRETWRIHARLYEGQYIKCIGGHSRGAYESFAELLKWQESALHYEKAVYLRFTRPCSIVALMDNDIIPESWTAYYAPAVSRNECHLHGPAVDCDIDDLIKKFTQHCGEPILKEISLPDYRFNMGKNDTLQHYLPEEDDEVKFRATYLLNRIVLPTTPVLLALGLPPYVIMWILQWLPAVWKIKDSKTMHVIDGVRASIQRVLEQRETKENKAAKT